MSRLDVLSPGLPGWFEVNYEGRHYKQFYEIDIFVNCIWVDTRWQQYSTHLHTNSIQNNTINLGTVRAVPCLCELYGGICLTAEEKAWKNLSQGGRRVPAGTMKTEYTEQNIHNSKNAYTKLNKSVRRITVHKRNNTKTQ